MPIDLGQIYAKIIVDTTAMTAGLQRARTEFAKFGGEFSGTMNAGTEAVKRQGGSIQQWKAQQDAAAKTIQQTTEEVKKQTKASGDSAFQSMRMASAMRQVASEMQTAGVAITGAFAIAVKSGAEWDRHLQTIQANTGITDAQTKQLRSTVESLGTTYGGSLQKIASGEMHAINLFHDMAAAQAITVAGAKAAIATGGDQETVINGLAKSLKEWNVPASQAGQYMNGLVFAANRANATLPEMMAHTDRVRATFANLNIPLSQMLALYSTLTQHGLSASQAETQLVNVTQKILQPTKQAQALIEMLSKTVDPGLKQAFSLAGLQGEGFGGIFQRITEDAKKMHVPVAVLAEKLFPNLRGVLAALIFSGTGVKDLHRNLAEFQQAFGRETEINNAVANSQKQLTTAAERLHNQYVALAGKIATDVEPGLRSIMKAAGGLFDTFGKLSEPTRVFLEWATAITGIGLLVGARILGIAAAFVQVRTALAAANAETAAMQVAAAKGIIFRIAVVLIGFEIAKEAIEWLKAQQDQQERKNDQARKDIAGADTGLHARNPDYQQFGVRNYYSASARKTLEAINREIDTGTVSHGFPGSRMELLQRDALNIIRDQERIRADIAKRKVGPANPFTGGRDVKTLDDMVKEWAQKQKDAARDAKAAAKDAERDAENTVQSIRDAQNKLFEYTHGEFANKRRQLMREISDMARDNVPAALRRAILGAGMKEIRGQEVEAARKAFSDMFDMGNLRDRANAMAGSLTSATVTKEAFGLGGFYESIVSTIRSVLAAAEKDALGSFNRERLANIVGAFKPAVQQMSETALGMAGNAQAALGRPRQWAAPPDHRWADFAQDQKKRADEMQKVWRDYRREVAGIFEGLFSDLLDGHKNIFGTILNDFKRMLVGMAAQAAAGSVVSGLKGLFGGLFGGGKTSSPLGAALTGMAGLFGFAEGGWVPGPVGKPVPAVVHGGEFVMSRDMLAGGGGVTIHVHPSPSMDERSLARAVGRQLQLQLRTR
jgi:TP901 family phage tail tape measure protein